LVICYSAFTARTIERLYPGAPTEVVYAPVALRSVPSGPDHRARIRRMLDTDTTAMVVIQASRSEAWKGHTRLIDALAALRDLSWVWWQVGGAQRPAEARYLSTLREQAAAAGIADRVRWLGERDDVGELLQAADIHCQANTAPEPFGVALVEALAAGLPVVTSELGGALEIVDASCGILVPPDDTSTLAAALRRLMADDELRRRLSSAGPARARRLCDPSTQLARLGAALMKLSPLTASAGS
jgi:glycosyltransferase involved in cell wall biosynthesis